MSSHFSGAALWTDPRGGYGENFSSYSRAGTHLEEVEKERTYLFIACTQNIKIDYIKSETKTSRCKTLES